MDDPGLLREGLQLTPGSSPLALRLGGMAILLMAAGIGILFLSHTRLPRTAFTDDLSFWWTALSRGCAVALWQSAAIVVLLGTCFMPTERYLALRGMYRAFLRSRMH